MTQSATRPAEQSGTFSIGGDLPVHRLGYGVMQLPGPGVWGPPRDHDEAIRVLRRTVELGVNLIDTADSYGPFVADHLIREALHPYPEGLVIATKVGFTRQGPRRWVPVGRPEYLRQQVELNLRHLGARAHRPAAAAPHRPRWSRWRTRSASWPTCRREGKIRHIGLSEVPVEHIEAARKIAPIVSVQNLYNLADRAAERRARRTASARASRSSRGSRSPPASSPGRAARSRGSPRTKGVTPSQLALAWLLHRSPVILPIPGTSSVAHLEENTAAAAVSLSDDEMRALTDATA